MNTITFAGLIMSLSRCQHSSSAAMPESTLAGSRSDFVEVGRIPAALQRLIKAAGEDLILASIGEGDPRLGEGLRVVGQ